MLVQSFKQQRECPAPVLIYPEQQGSLAWPLTITQWDGDVQLIVLLIDISRPEELNSVGFNFFFFLATNSVYGRFTGRRDFPGFSSHPLASFN